MHIMKKGSFSGMGLRRLWDGSFQSLVSRSVSQKGPLSTGPSRVPAGPQSLMSFEHFVSFHKCSLVSHFRTPSGCGAAVYPVSPCRAWSRVARVNREKTNNADNGGTNGHMGWGIRVVGLGRFGSGLVRVWSGTGLAQNAQRMPKE